MDPEYLEHHIPVSSSRAVRAKLLIFGVLMLLAGIALASTAGPPRVPSGVPRPDEVVRVLAGATLPLNPLLVVVIDAAWTVWLWMVLSLALECMLAAADLLTHGGSRWVRSVRHFADRASVPLVRRAVAAAFAVQVISRGVPIAAAQSLAPDHAIVVAANQVTADSAASATPVAESSATYLVRPGDTLWSIAEQAYGSGAEYPRLVDANAGRSMSDGQVFSRRGVIRPGWQLVAPGATWHVQVVDGQRWYTVQAGESLSSIAASTLGDSQRWSELFQLNRGATGDGGKHVLTDPNTIWPGMRLQLPDAPADANEPTDSPATPEAEPSELHTASTTPAVADRHVDEPPATATASTAEPTSVEPPPSPPLLRTHHSLQPVVLDSSDAPPEVAPVPTSPPADGAAAISAQDSEVSLPAPPWRSDVPLLPLAVGGLGVAGAVGLAYGARRIRRLRPLPRQPESDIIVEGGFAEAQLAHDLTRGLHGMGFDPVAALVRQFAQLIAESAIANAPNLGVLAVRHGRSSTTLTLRCALPEQASLIELAPAFAHALGAEVEACVSADQDVLWRLTRLRKTRLLPSTELAREAPCLVPLGVLYDRQVYSVAWDSLGHVLVASMPGHGADTILTSLVATVTARRSPQHVQSWVLGSARSLPAPLFDLPHLIRHVDPADETALVQAADDLRRELDRRATHRPEADLLVVIPELSTLGHHAARFALLAPRALGVGVRFVASSSNPDLAIGDTLTTHFSTRMVLRMQTEEASVALLGVADAAFLGGGGRLLLRLDGREPVELYGYQVATEHLERLIKVMRSAYPSRADSRVEPSLAPDEAADATAANIEIPEAVADTPGQQCTDLDAGGDETEMVPEPCLPRIQIQCFGNPSVTCLGQVVWPHSGGEAKPWELLLFLAVQSADGVSKEAAAQALWPQDEIVEEVAHRVRQLRFRLRRQLQQVPDSPQADGICFDRRSLRLDPCVVYSDAQEFLALIRSVRINPGDDAIERLERARALYVGDLLTGPDVRRYAWLDERDDSGVTLREHFRRQFENASLRLAELYADAGELDLAVALYRELTEMDPAEERLWQALFRLHAQRADRAALVAEEQRLRTTLRELAAELDVSDGALATEPGRDTTLEFQRLLAGLREREPATV